MFLINIYTHTPFHSAFERGWEEEDAENVWVVCSSLHLFSMFFPSKIHFLKVQWRVSERSRKAGSLAVQDRGLVWRQQVGSGMAAITCLALAAPGAPLGSTRAPLRQLCPPECLLQFSAQGK